MTAPIVATTRVLVSGRVQGVSFRDWTQREARQRGLRGWVRNRRDGRVEAIFEGPAAAVEAMVAACLQGPRFARVDAVDAEPAEPLDAAADFAVLPTA